jgi:hypothetical protein
MNIIIKDNTNTTVGNKFAIPSVKEIYAKHKAELIKLKVYDYKKYVQKIMQIFPKDTFEVGVNRKPKFISLYTDKTRIYENGEFVYFCTFNSVSPHLPLIFSGKIEKMELNEEYDKTYYIKFSNVEESEEVAKKHIINNNFGFTYIENSSRTPNVLPHKFSYKLNFDKYFFRIPSFFVKDKIDDILYIRNLYIQVIYNEMKRDIGDLIELQNRINMLEYETDIKLMAKNK